MPSDQVGAGLVEITPCGYIQILPCLELTGGGQLLTQAGFGLFHLTTGKETDAVIVAVKAQAHLGGLGPLLVVTVILGCSHVDVAPGIEGDVASGIHTTA
ncbi:hypothetical protein D3C80_1858430 [compost metagenome]